MVFFYHSFIAHFLLCFSKLGQNFKNFFEFFIYFLPSVRFSLSEEELESRLGLDQAFGRNVEIPGLNQGQENGDDIALGLVHVLDQDPMSGQDGFGQDAGLPDKVPRNVRTDITAQQTATVRVGGNLVQFAN